MARGDDDAVILAAVAPTGQIVRLRHRLGDLPAFAEALPGQIVEQADVVEADLGQVAVHREDVAGLRGRVRVAKEVRLRCEPVIPIDGEIIVVGEVSDGHVVRRRFIAWIAVVSCGGEAERRAVDRQVSKVALRQLPVAVPNFRVPAPAGVAGKLGQRVVGIINGIALRVGLHDPRAGLVLDIVRLPHAQHGRRRCVRVQRCVQQRGIVRTDADLVPLGLCAGIVHIRQGGTVAKGVAVDARHARRDRQRAVCVQRPVKSAVVADVAGCGLRRKRGDREQAEQHDDAQHGAKHFFHSVASCDIWASPRAAAGGC